MDYYHYYVEGQDEEKLVNVLKSDMRNIEAGRVQVLNAVTERITALRLRTLKKGTIVILVFDTDTKSIDILKENIETLLKCNNVKCVYCIPQVSNLEEELVYSCNIREIGELLGTQSVKEFKRQLILEKNLQRKLEAAGFDFGKFWSREPKGVFSEIHNDADKIKK